MGVSENSVPLNPMVNDHYPYSMAIIGNIPNIFRQTHVSISLQWIFPPRWIRGWTPLLWAAGNGCVEVVELLLESGASVEAKTNAGGGPRGIKLGPVGCLSFEDDVIISTKYI